MILKIESIICQCLNLMTLKLNLVLFFWLLSNCLTNIKDIVEDTVGKTWCVVNDKPQER